MPDITRGLTFQPNERATASKLHRLVDAAAISNLTTDDFAGTIALVGTATPASIAEGDVWQGFEGTQFESSTYSGIFQHNAYFVKTMWEEVKLFDPYGFETTRFINSSGDIGTLDPGEPCEVDGPGGGETLVGFANTSGLNEIPHAVYGGVIATTVSGAAGRVIMRGFGMAITEAERSIGTGWPHAFRKRGSVTTTFGITQATNTQCILGHRMSGINFGSGFRRVPVLYYGGPVWRP